MNDALAPHTERCSAPPPPSCRPIACIDLDRFCEGCGYNLRTLPVYREEGTGIPVVRCPECGRYLSANDASTALRPWLDRLTAMLLGVWILGIIATLFFLGLAQGAMSYSTLDELTIPGGYTTQRIDARAITYSWTGRSGPLEVRTEYHHFKLFIAFVLFISFLLAFSGGMFIVVTVPHWPWAAYCGLVLSISATASGIVAVSWNQEAAHLLVWGLTYIVGHFTVQVLGGVTGVTFGRALARITVRTFLPPSIRPRLAFLWIVDGKALPRPCRV